jgi:hypothetical protein
MTNHDASVATILTHIRRLNLLDEQAAIDIIDVMRSKLHTDDRLEWILLNAADKIQESMEREIEEDGNPRQPYASTL